MFRVFLQICLVLILSAHTAQAANPSQVLVLYNADWTDDAFLTDPGQDSKEIAEYYVRMHTDPETGEKPYILGLNCRHGIKVIDEVRHLNQAHLAEKSSDNKAGVELIKRRWLVGADIRDDELRDSRLVEFTLPGKPEGWKRETLQVTIEPVDVPQITIIKNGLIETVGKVAGNLGKEWTVRFDARAFAKGGLKVSASCENTEGKRSDWNARYVDIDDVRFSPTGRDGMRDDRNYLEDVEVPLKAFLEDPKNARPDGTLLKDHILFIVVAYGLPRTVSATWGIARGVTDNLNDHGAIIDFGQRLQLLYYNEAQVMGIAPKPHRFAGKGPFSDFLLRAPQAWPLIRRKTNPYLHPQVYEKGKRSLDDVRARLVFSVENRKKQPEAKFLYFSMRLDGANAVQAKALIDKAIYASAHGLPRVNDDAPVPKGLAGNKTARFLWGKGYRHLYLPSGRGGHRLHFGSVEVDGKRSFLPGGIAATVISHNALDSKGAEVYGFLDQGVTLTAAAAKYMRGAPHIHDKSWWDDSVFFPLMIQGETAGNALLANQTHLGWITAFLGDPLMCLPTP